MTAQRPRTASISGPLEVSTAYFDRYYGPRIETAIARHYHFVVGPVSGIDALALEHLLKNPRVSPDQIKVYMAGFEVAARPAFVQELNSRGVQIMKVADARTTWDRDVAMTRASDYDILRYRTEWEQKAMFKERWRPRVSNTERNERRRRRWEANGRSEDEKADESKVNVSEEDVKERYVTHVGGVLKKMLRRWMGRKSGEAGQHEECDGTCNGHRDVVFWPLLITGSSAFGFGNDGIRMR